MRRKLLLLSVCVTLAHLLLSFHEVSAAEVRLAWNPSPDSLVTGYRIYYGRSSQIYTDNVDAGRSTEFTITGLDAGVTYFFTCTAYTAGGAESNSTNEVSYTVPGGGSPSPGGSGGGGGCFIATAAYGSRLAPEVATLREFRDRYLMTNRPGRAFVGWYGRVSPPVAAFIAKHETLRAAVRLGLTPVVYGAKYPVAGLVAIVLVTGVAVLGRREEGRSRMTRSDGRRMKPRMTTVNDRSVER